MIIKGWHLLQENSSVNCCAMDSQVRQDWSLHDLFLFNCSPMQAKKYIDIYICSVFLFVFYMPPQEPALKHPSMPGAGCDLYNIYHKRTGANARKCDQ